MLELSMDKICTEFMENTCVENTNGNAVGSEIESKEDVEAVVHDSVSDFAHGVATVFEITLEQMDFSEVNDWVLWPEFVKRNGDLGYLCDF